MTQIFDNSIRKRFQISQKQIRTGSLDLSIKGLMLYAMQCPIQSSIVDIII